jgi:hypothetical protein
MPLRSVYEISVDDSNVHDMAAKWGLVWGGDWKSGPDPMHFQWGGSKPWLSANTDASPTSRLPTMPTDYIFGTAGQEKGRWATDPVSGKKYWQAAPQRPGPNSSWFHPAASGKSDWPDWASTAASLHAWWNVGVDKEDGLEKMRRALDADRPVLEADVASAPHHAVPNIRGNISGSVGNGAKVSTNVNNLTGGYAIISANQIAH